MRNEATVQTGELILQNVYNRKVYRAVVSQELVKTTPEWNEREGNPPLSARRAIEIARTALVKQGWYEFDVRNLTKNPSVTLTLFEVKNRWIYVVNFSFPNHGNRFQVPVLMDGVVPPFSEAP
ncbi:MAG TPA: hypothetical protein VM680_15455 [Verrucomicrobiae bacterium]|nr:hypothetical protein [Verrucomicrobiae bacterium]